MSPLLHDLHRLRVPQRIESRIAVLVYRCQNGTAPSYLADGLQRVADISGLPRRCDKGLEQCTAFGNMAVQEVQFAGFRM